MEIHILLWNPPGMCIRLTALFPPTQMTAPLGTPVFSETPHATSFTILNTVATMEDCRVMTKLCVKAQLLPVLAEEVGTGAVTSNVCA